ncbi:STAS domain-containing protein [Actinophytocola sp. NPDC049390]|uniref:STAS domain-containing protein n=1 Tax=Actinophytocola sp. NPDC049390 TaxID=3363894 RepID=UPI00378DC054
MDEKAPDVDLLSMTSEVTDRAVLVHAVGEVDHLTAPQLAAELGRAGLDASSTRPVVLDMTSVSFMTSAGLAVLVEHHRGRRAHHALRIVVGGSPVGQSLRRTGLHQFLSTYDTLAEALADGPGRSS